MIQKPEVRRAKAENEQRIASAIKAKISLMNSLRVGFGNWNINMFFPNDELTYFSQTAESYLIAR